MLDGTPGREDNKLQAKDRAAHDWYRFVLSFPPHLVRRYVERFGLKGSHRMLDPFCGTGTTLVECKKLGVPSVGVEANPMACFASRVKVDWSADPNGLVRHAQEVARAVTRKLEEQGIDDLNGLPLFQAESETSRSLRTLPEESWKLLLKDSISPLPLHKTLLLLATLEEYKDDRFDPCERLAAAKSTVSGISNLHFGPEVGVGPAKDDAPVVSLWLANVRAMAADLKDLQGRPDTKSEVIQGDSRNLSAILAANSVDAVITSPPYPNEKDYTRTTRLESVLLGFIHNRKELRSLKQSLVRSNTRGVFAGDRDDRQVADHTAIQKLAEEIERRRIDLCKTSGFERLYPRVTRLYFGGMAQHLSGLRSVLRPGAQLAYVVGDQASYLRVMIRTGQIIADIAKSLRYEVVGMDLFRTRLATATREQLREEVVLLRWPG
jgi:hypothetical protein